MTGNLKLKARVESPPFNFTMIQFLHASTEELKALMETSELYWYASTYIMLEPLLNKILAEQSAELKIELLLHLARLRGGVVDLL